MALRIVPISEAEANTPRRGLGVLRDDGVDANGVDFDLTAWAGERVLVTFSAAGRLAWFEATGQTITATDSTTAQSAPSGAQLTNGATVAAGAHPMLVPLSDLATPVVVLRVAAGTGTITVEVERA